MVKIVGVFFQVFGLLFGLLFSVGVGALGLYEIYTGRPSALTELGNMLTVLSFFGAIPIGLLILGFALVKKATGGRYYTHNIFELLGKLVSVPLGVAFAVSAAIITVPMLIYSYFQYKKGIENGVIRFIKWTLKDWWITLMLYSILVFAVFSYTF